MAKIVKTLHTDAGHSWLAVKRAELKMLGIENNISNYSYEKNKTVYLETDQDAGLYIEAMAKKHITVECIEAKHADISRVRSYQRYTPELQRSYEGTV
jgi:hypothetical protein